MSIGLHLRRILANPARGAMAALLALASAACEDPGTEPGPEPQAQILFLSTRDGATNAFGPLSEIYRMNEDGTGVENLTRQPAVYHTMSVSPDRKRILFTRLPGPELWVMNADGTGQSRLATSGIGARWSPDGSKIAFATNREGRVSGTAHGVYDVYVMNADGSNQRNVSHTVSAELGTDVKVAGWSPGGQVVFQTTNHVNRVAVYRVYMVNPDGTGVRTLFPGSTDHSPAWSPDGSKVVFLSERDGVQRLYIMNADGSGERRLTTHDTWDFLPGISGAGTGTIHDYSPWSPDGMRIAFHTFQPFVRINVVNADGSGLRPVTNQTSDFNGWSPDGTQIAFTSQIDGQKDVYTVAWGGGQPAKLTSSPFIDTDALWTLKR